MSEMRVNGVRLYYEEHGAGDPILCIHGTGSSAAFWVDATHELATHGRTIVYDRRGFARSERPEPFVTSVHQHTDDAAALLDALGAAPAIVIGRSYGGNVALDLALRYPDRVRALALLEGGPETLSESAMRWVAALEHELLAAAEEDMTTVAETLIRGVAGDGVWEGFPEEARQIFTDNGPAIVAELRGGLLEIGMGELGSITQPTLLVGGTESLPAFIEVTEVMAKAMPRAKVEWVEGRHLINPAHPAVLAFDDEVLALKEEPSIA
jgi:pimeloyl-ACP methyl ester carboxylesterase